MIWWKCISVFYSAIVAVYPYNPDHTKFILSVNDREGKRQTIITLEQVIELSNQIWNDDKYKCETEQKGKDKFPHKEGT